jgi:hypothetical protein
MMQPCWHLLQYFFPEVRETSSRWFVTVGSITKAAFAALLFPLKLEGITLRMIL